MSPFSSSPLENDPIIRELKTGERLIWFGRPQPDRVFQSRVAWAILCLLLFVGLTGLFCFTVQSVLSSKNPAPTSLVGVVVAWVILGSCILIPLAYVVLLPWIAKRRAEVTFYALTNQRAFIIVEGAKPSLQSVRLLEFKLHCRNVTGDDGDLLIKRVIRGSRRRPYPEETVLLSIEKVREVEQLFLKLAASEGNDARLYPKWVKSP